jgi:hypothetical protein
MQESGNEDSKTVSKSKFDKPKSRQMKWHANIVNNKHKLTEIYPTEAHQLYPH